MEMTENAPEEDLINIAFLAANSQFEQEIKDTEGIVGLT